MALWAIVPVKRLRRSKSRLAGVLEPAARAALIGGFLQRMLAELRQVEGLAATLVVSPDPVVWAIAQRQAVLLLKEERPLGLNSAVQQATAVAVADGATGVLVLPADLPFLGAADVAQMLAGRPFSQPTLVIAGDAQAEGTNALLVTSPDQFTFQYGPGSFQRHLQEAERWAMATEIVNSPGLQFDLDTEEDWQVYQQAHHQPHGAACAV